MVIKEMIEVFEILDSPHASGACMEEYFRQIHPKCAVSVRTLVGEQGKTDAIRIIIPGKKGKSCQGKAPTIGLIGRLGGLGARPERIGFVSDGDGALSVLSAAAKLLKMHRKGDILDGDVIVTTHICPDAPTHPHKPVAFMGSPIDMMQMNEAEVDCDADAILSVDTTKGNRIINHNGIAISPTVKEGYILRVSEDLLNLIEIATGSLPQVFPLSMQDITPYGNHLYHLNSILQPAIATTAPVTGVAITSETAVPGCATGATNLSSLDCAVRYMIEVAKAFTAGECSFYDEEEYEKLTQLYGTMKHLCTLGKTDKGR